MPFNIIDLVSCKKNDKSTLLVSGNLLAREPGTAGQGLKHSQSVMLEK
jgi:hypothetical protein